MESDTANLNTEIKHVDLFIHESDVESGALKLLKVVRPAWKPDNIRFKHFTDGISNKLVGCYEEGKFKADVVNVRIHGEGTELMIDREAEQKNILLLSAAGCSPPLYAVFQNGIAYGFLQGETLDEVTVRQENIRKLIAKEMCRMHGIRPSDGREPKDEMFEKVEQFLKVAPDSFQDVEMQNRFTKEVKPKSELLLEFEELKRHLLALNCPAVFSHNDLLLKNIIYNPETGKLGFIDHEYAMYSYEPFDIGDHFCEYAGVDEVDYSRYPDKNYQLKWLKDYLGYWNEQNGKPYSDVSDLAVETLYVQVNKFALCAHFFWGVWGLIQAKHSTIDFDFLGYAIIRLNEYFARKEEFLSLQVPSL